MSNIEENNDWFQKQLDFIEEVGGKNEEEEEEEEDEDESSLEEKLEILKKNEYSLQNLDESLRNNFEIVIEALKHDETQFRYLTDEAKNNRAFILGLCREEILKSLFILNERFQGDLEIVLELVKINSNNFLAASQELKNCEIFVKLLMENYNLRLRLVGDELRKKKDFVLWSANIQMEKKVFKMTDFLRCVNPELLQTEDFIFGLVSLDPSLITYFDSVKRKEKFVSRIAQSLEDTTILEYVDRDIKESVMSELGIVRLEPVEEIISEATTNKEPVISLTMPSDDEDEEDDPEKMNEFFQNVLDDQKKEEEEQENPQEMADFFQNVLDDLND